MCKCDIKCVKCDKKCVRCDIKCVRCDKKCVRCDIKYVNRNIKYVKCVYMVFSWNVCSEIKPSMRSICGAGRVNTERVSVVGMVGGCVDTGALIT